MKLSALMQDVEMKRIYTNDTEVSNVTDSTQNVRHGSVFVCIKGRKTDGHKYVAKAIEKGAVAIVCEDEIDCANSIIVENTSRAYALMCANFYGNCHKKMRIVGVTGTNGKTTTTYVLKKILEDCGYKVGIIGTVSVLIGKERYPADLTTPDPADLHRYFMMMSLAGCDVCIMEVSSQALVQNRVYSINFFCGVFTNISPEHLDYHKTMENYAYAKSILMMNCENAVINSDDSFADYMIKTAKDKYVTFSARHNADYVADKAFYDADGVSYTLTASGLKYHVSFNMMGSFSVYNSLAALSVAGVFKVDMPRALRSISDFDGISGRMEKIKNDLGINIIIDFAHTPDSLENVLKTLKTVYSHGKLITVFGCGGDRDKTKRPVMGEIACRYSDIVFITSDNPRTEDPDAIINEISSGIDLKSVFKITDRTSAIRYAINSAKSGDTVLIAGKGHEKYQILGNQKIYYNEREIILKLLEDKMRF